MLSGHTYADLEFSWSRSQLSNNRRHLDGFGTSPKYCQYTPNDETPLFGLLGVCLSPPPHPSTLRGNSSGCAPTERPEQGHLAWHHRASKPNRCGSRLTPRIEKRLEGEREILLNPASTTSITICSLSHSDVWKLTSSLLPKFVTADRFEVYVPRTEVPQFEEISPPEFTILSQESLASKYRDQLLRAVTNAGNLERFGWYLQQFLKIEALLLSKTARSFIWDADCVPVAPIKLFNSSGEPIYMRGTEFHEPYFEAIRRLTGLERVQQHSFVIPGFPIKTQWIKEIVEVIEERHPGMTWAEAIIATTDFSLRSGFSETETLGTWVANNRGPLNLSVHPWERRGQSRFGFARTFSPLSVTQIGQAHGLDIVSFENWDHGKKIPFSKKLRKAIRRVKRYLSSVRMFGHSR